MITLIYLDMDGVLTDFNNYYLEKIGINPHDIRPEDWSENWQRWVMSEYFVTMPKLNGANLLLEYIAQLGIKTEILSSSGGTDYFDDICRQKREWLRIHKIDYHANIVPGRKFKTQYATPHRMLIDDQRKIIDKWNAAEGIGIHHDGDMIKTIQNIRDILNERGYRKYGEAL